MLYDAILPMIGLSIGFGTLLYLIKTCTKAEKEEQEKATNTFIDTGDTINICGAISRVYYDPKTEIVYLISRGTVNSFLTPLYNDKRIPMKIKEYNESYKK